MFTIGTGGIVLIFGLLIVGYILGFANGIGYIMAKIKKLFPYEEYRNILTILHADANKED